MFELLDNEIIQQRFKDIYNTKINQFKILDGENALVIFLDGKDVTKDHNNYNLLSGSFLNDVYDSINDTINEFKIDCQTYIMIDEISIIIRDVSKLEKFGVDSCIEYITALFVQPFLKNIWGKFPDVRYKFYGFMLPVNDIARYINYRKLLCHNISFIYYCKEKLPNYKDFNRNLNELINLCKNNNLMDEYIENKAFSEGIYKEYRFTDVVLDDFAKMLQF